MRLLRLADVEPSPGERVFRYSPARASLLWALGIAAAGALVAAGARSQAAWLCDGIAGLLGLGLLLMQRFVLARFRPSNWLVRLRDDGLYVQFRSYLNHHFPAGDATVVFVPFEEIQSARLVRETITVRRQNERTTQRRRLLELELGGETATLAQALKAEATRRAPDEKHWYGTSSTAYDHHPVRLVSATTLQVEWGVVPRIDALLEVLRYRTTVAPAIDVSGDYTRLKAASREEQEAALRKLVATGQRIAAVDLARWIYGYGLTQAKTFVDGLATG